MVACLTISCIKSGASVLRPNEPRQHHGRNAHPSGNGFHAIILTDLVRAFVRHRISLSLLGNAPRVRLQFDCDFVRCAGGILARGSENVERRLRDSRSHHAFNKLLKDFIVRLKTMEGYDSPYVPGWDCHGLPIEIKVDGQLGSKKAGMTAE